VLGSRNSSNSNRLAEIAKQKGKPAHLIDRVSEMRADWFKPTDTVLVTAGASAPEEHVQDCGGLLVEHFAAEVEHRTIREEHVSFPLPKELRVISNR